MSTSQIDRIFFKTNKDGSINKYSYIVTRRRLKKLRKYKLIRSYIRNNKDMIHSIDQRGVYIVAGMLGKAFNDLYFSRQNDLIAYSQAEHSLLLSDVYIKLLDETKERPGEIVLFQVEQLNYEAFELNGKKYRFKPDIFFIYRPKVGENIVRLFYVEVDNGTEPPKVFAAEKVRNYEAFFKSGIFQEKYNGLFPAIIVICKDYERANKLKNKVNSFLNWKFLKFDDLGVILD